MHSFASALISLVTATIISLSHASPDGVTVITPERNDCDAIQRLGGWPYDSVPYYHPSTGPYNPCAATVTRESCEQTEFFGAPSHCIWQHGSCGSTSESSGEHCLTIQDQTACEASPAFDVSSMTCDWYESGKDYAAFCGYAHESTPWAQSYDYCMWNPDNERCDTQAESVIYRLSCEWKNDTCHSASDPDTGSACDLMPSWVSCLTKFVQVQVCLHSHLAPLEQKVFDSETIPPSFDSPTPSPSIRPFHDHSSSGTIDMATVSPSVSPLSMPTQSPDMTPTIDAEFPWPEMGMMRTFLAGFGIGAAIFACLFCLVCCCWDAHLFCCVVEEDDVVDVEAAKS